MVVLNLQFVGSATDFGVTYGFRHHCQCVCTRYRQDSMMFDIAHEVGKNAGKDDEWGMQTFAKDITLENVFLNQKMQQRLSVSLLDLT